MIGLVQGVFFRASTQHKAKELGLNGYVRNDADRSVYIEAEGPKELLDNLVDWCRMGPPQAKVEEVLVEQDIVKDFQGFSIQR